MAFDGAGNLSAQSNSASVTTPAGNNYPTDLALGKSYSASRRVRARLRGLSGRGAKDLLTNAVLKLEAHGADSTADFSMPAGGVRVLMIDG